MTPRQRPAPPPDLAGRYLARFFTDYLAGERAASPRTIASYRDALKLLLIWFKTAEHVPPEKLRLADLDRPRILRFLTWLETERGCSASTRNQRLAVIRSFCRYTAVEQPDHLDQVTQILAIRQKKTPAPSLGHLTGDAVKMLLAEPGTNGTRAVRDTVLLSLAYDTAARVQELCDLNVADVRRSTPMTVTIRGKGSKTRYLPVTGPTAGLIADYLKHHQPHPGVGADADPLFHGPKHARLTRSGVSKLLARHVRAVRARDPDWAPGLRVTTRTLRRSRAMHLIQAGVNLIYIRDLLGHADIATTEIYARADAETKRKAIENAYHPLTPDTMPDWTADTSLIGWLDSLGRRHPATRDYADTDTTGAAPTSGKPTAGHITLPSALCRLCGIPHKRHTAALRMSRDESLSMRDVQTILGHAHLSTTADVYLIEDEDQVIRRVQQHLIEREHRAQQTPPRVAVGYDTNDLSVLFGGALQ